MFNKEKEITRDEIAAAGEKALVQLYEGSQDEELDKLR